MKVLTCISCVGIYASLNGFPCNLSSKQLLPVFLSPLMTIFTEMKHDKEMINQYSVRKQLCTISSSMLLCN